MSEATTLAPPTRDQFKPLTKVETLGELFRHPEFAKRIEQAIPKHMSGERLLRTIVTAVQKTPKLGEVSPMSMLGACITIAALGLEPNTPLQHCHLIPFEVNKWNPQTRKREYIRTDVQVIIGYPGYIDLIYRSGLVKDIDCQVFYHDEVDNGSFSYERGTNKHLKHKPSDKIRRPDEEPAGAYMYAKLADGGEVFEVLSLAKIHLARSRSQGFTSAMYAHDDAIKAGKDPKKDKRYSEAPWIKDFEAMARKTALRAGQKWLPKSIEFAAALGTDEAPIDFSKLSDASMVFDGTYAVVPEEEGAPENQAEQTKPAAQTAKKPAATKPPEKAAQAPAAAKVEVAEKPVEQPSEPPQGEKVTFYPLSVQYYPLFNEWGEEDDGPSGPTTSAIDYANKFGERYNALSRGLQEAFLDHNAESVGLARTASEQAADILASVLVPKKPEIETPKPEIPLAIERQKTTSGNWDVKAYLSDAAFVLEKVASPEELSAFIEANAENSIQLPRIAKNHFLAQLSAKARQLEPPPPGPADDTPEEEVPFDDEPAAQDLQPPLEPPPYDQWDKTADGMRQDFMLARNQHELRASIGNSAVQSRLRALKDARPDLAKQLDDEYEARLNELMGVKA